MFAGYYSAMVEEGGKNDNNKKYIWLYSGEHPGTK